MRHNGVNRDRPQRDEDHPGREPGAVGDRTADQSGGDDREPQLEGGEQQLGNRPARGVRVDAKHADVGEVADQARRAVLGERDGVTDQQPRNGHQRDRDEAHHDHVQHAGRADHAAVEDGKSWGHQQDKRCAGEQPCGGGRIDRVQFGLPPGSEKSICARFGRVTESSQAMGDSSAGLARLARDHWCPSCCCQISTTCRRRV